MRLRSADGLAFAADVDAFSLSAALRATSSDASSERKYV